jgi:hypothetical protein
MKSVIILHVLALSAGAPDPVSADGMARTSAIDQPLVEARSLDSVHGLGSRPRPRFRGGGVLDLGPQTCLTFHADTGESFFLENTGGFWRGDSVYVDGIVNPESDICFPVVGRAIEDNTIRACFRGCGVLERGPQTCVTFTADDTGEYFFLDNTAPYMEGDRVHVVGPIVEDSTICSPLVGRAIEDNTICGCFSGCGLLAVGPQSCVRFVADSGESYFVENTGLFWAGDYVHVSGPVRDDSQLCFPLIGPAIEDNRISACFADCGTLHRGPQSCVTFLADTGDAYFLGNSGAYWPGDRVFVNGPINEESWRCYPLIGRAIERNTVAPCPDPDP